MADEKKDRDTAVTEAKAADAEVKNVNKQIVETLLANREAMTAADQEVVAAEMQAGKTIAKANEDLERVRAKAEEKKLKALQELEDTGFVAAMWGGNLKLQCVWCPWDSMGSPTGDLDPFDRMRQHLSAADPTTHSGPARYGRNGLPLTGV